MSLKGLYEVLEENVTIFAIFHNRRFFYSTSYFLSEKDPDAVKIVSHILKSLFYLNLENLKNLKNFKLK